MANRMSAQSPSMQDQVPNQMRIGIEIPLDPDMPELELSPSRKLRIQALTTSWDSFNVLMWRLWNNGLTSQIL